MPLTDSNRQLPSWMWWVIGIGVIATVAVIVVATIRDRGPVLPPGLVEKRNAVNEILSEASHTTDVDIKPLVELEATKNYRSAVALMDDALAANETLARFNSSLVGLADELVVMTDGVKPTALAEKAVAAFGLLADLARTEQKFYAGRRELYTLTRAYYAGLAAKESPPIPANLREVVESVNADLEKTKRLQRDFAFAIQAFDQAVSGGL